MNWKIPRFFPLKIFLIALFLRLLPVLLTQDMGIGLDDMFQYDMLARSLASGNGYRWYAEVDLPTVLPYLELDLESVDYDPRGIMTSFRPPLYPSFLAGIYFIFGMGIKRFFVTRLIQAGLAAALAPLTYIMAQHLFKDKEAFPRIAAWIICCYPMLVIYPLSIATENLFFVLILCSIITLLKAKESLETSVIQSGKVPCFLFRSRWFLLSGILLGMTCLTRSVIQVFTILAVVWIWIILKERRMAMIVLVMAFIVVIPWITRNSMLYGHFSGIESALGYDLYLGYHPQGTGTFQYPQSLDLMTMANDYERDQVGIQKTMEFIIADPGRVIELLIYKTGYFFGLERRALTYFYSNNFFGHIPAPILAGIFTLFCLPFTIVIILAVAGLALTKWKKETWLVVIFLIGYIGPHLLIISEDRFHLTTLPILATLGAYSWTEGWKAIRQRWMGSRFGKFALLLALLIIMLLLVNWGLELWRDAGKLSLLFGMNGNQSYFSY